MTEPLWSDHNGIIYATLPYFEETHGTGYRTIQTWIATGRARSMKANGATYVHLGDALRLQRDAKLRNRAQDLTRSKKAP